MLSMRARLLIATLWAGSLWTVGYLVAPTLFSTLSDRVLAGTIASSLFHVQAWVSVFCALALVLLLVTAAKEISTKERKFLFFIVIGMLGCSLIAHFGLQPLMAELRAAAGPNGVMMSDTKTRFGILHGISSLLYLMQSLLAVALIIKIR